MAITTINSNDNGANSLIKINDNFTDLDTTKADLASPTFTGTPTLPTGTIATTQSAGDNSTKVATTAYADTAGGGIKAKVRAYKSGADQALTTSYAKILFETETYDTGSNFATSTFTAPRDGYYFVTANISGIPDGSDSNRSISVAIYKEGVIHSRSASAKSSPTADPGATGCVVTDIIFLSATDTIEIYALCNVNGQVSADTGSPNTYVTIREL